MTLFGVDPIKPAWLLVTKVTSPMSPMATKPGRRVRSQPFSQRTVAIATAAATPKADEDRYVGYYYPKPTAIETYTSPMQTIAGAERAQRVQFATVVSQGSIQSAYRVPY